MCPATKHQEQESLFNSQSVNNAQGGQHTIHDPVLTEVLAALAVCQSNVQALIRQSSLMLSKGKVVDMAAQASAAPEETANNNKGAGELEVKGDEAASKKDFNSNLISACFWCTCFFFCLSKAFKDV